MRTIVALPLATAFSALVFAVGVSSPLAQPRGGGKTEVLPVTKAAPAVVVIETTGKEADLRHQLRSKNSVAELAGTGTMRFSEAPTGTFAFIAPQPLGLALVTQSPDMLLERVASAPNAFEIHKLSDGSGLLVGFIAHNAVGDVTPEMRPKNVRVAIHSNRSDDAPHIAAVPLVKLMVDRMPNRLDPKKPDSVVVLEADLQSTANRKSPHMDR